MEELILACDLRPILEWGEIYRDTEAKERYGRYHSSNFSIPGFGKTAWVIAAHIVGDIDKYLQMGYREEEIVNACINDLNRPPRKRARKPRYGDKLMLHKYKFLKDKEGVTYIGVALVTKKKRNKNFWGKGQKLYTSV
tara:strand:- start:1936 stop:2349 length:414 start_codon:yes stop_codon:yes gene_type:complete